MIVAEDSFQCNSPRVFVSNELRLIPPEVCESCLVADKAVGERIERASGTKSPARAKPINKLLTCTHRGEPTGDTIECDTCKGKTRLKVFACAVHNITDAKFCRGCKEYEAKKEPVE